MIRVAKEEGLAKLFNGANWATMRAVLMTIGQLCFYDQIKQTLLETPYFSDNLVTHFTSSLGAVGFFKKFLRDFCFYFLGCHRYHHDTAIRCSENQVYEC